MVLSSGTKGLRLVSIVGALFAVAGVGLAIYLIVARLFFDASTAARLAVTDGRCCCCAAAPSCSPSA